MRNLNLVMSLFLICFFLMSCSKKGTEESRVIPSTNSSTTGAVTGVTAASGRSVPSGTQSQASYSGALNGVKMEWIASEKPIWEKTRKGQNYFYVVNIVRFNGKNYEFPTIHYSSGSAPILAKTGYFTIDGVDFDLDADCVDLECSQYAVSVRISKNSQDIQQMMVYMDFTNRNQALVALNDKSYFMNFSQFYDLIRKYYNT